MKKLFFMALVSGALFSGCANNTENSNATTNTPIEIAGSYTDSYGGTHEITETTWIQGGTYGTSGYTFTKVDNEQNFAIAQNFDNNSYNSGKYSRFDWTGSSSTSNLYYCQTAYNKDNATAAESVTAADNSSPATSGCGSFSWSKLTAQ